MAQEQESWGLKRQILLSVESNEWALFVLSKDKSQVLEKLKQMNFNFQVSDKKHCWGDEIIIVQVNATAERVAVLQDNPSITKILPVVHTQPESILKN